MRILVTGGAGFVGSHLTDKLLGIGHEVLVIDNYQTGRRDNLTEHAGLTVVEDTIANRKTVDRIFEDFQPNQVVHAAASYKNPDNWEEDVMTNVLGTVNIVEATKQSKANRLIYFQTALCYGLHPVEQPITLDHPLFSGKSPGGSSYAISKTGGEQYIELSGLNFLSFRLANAYGPRNMSGPLPTFFYRLSNNKPCFVMDTRRDFVFIDDMIEVVLKAIQGEGKKGYYHISSGSDYSIEELFGATVRAMALRPEPEVEVRKRSDDDVYTILLDPSNTKRDFGWEVTTPLENGVQAAIEYYKKYGIEETYTHLKVQEAENRDE